MMHVSWTTLQEQIFAKLRRPYRSEANMNEVGHDFTTLLIQNLHCSSIFQRYQPLYLPNIIFLALCFELFLNLRIKIEKILYYTRFISHFLAIFCFIKNACDKMVSCINSYNKLLLSNLLF
jgi:hypothetical protein